MMRCLVDGGAAPTAERAPAAAHRRGWRRAVMGGALLFGSVLIGLAAAEATAAAAVRMLAAAPRRATAARWQRRAEADERLAMTMTLPLRRGAALQALLAAQQDPASPLYHQWLTPAEFARRFGATAADYAAVVDWLQASGFAVRSWPNRLRVDFTGSVGRVEGVFGVHMNHYRCRAGSCLANAEPPQLPAPVAGRVAFVRLDTFPLAHPLVRVIGPAGESLTTMGPHDMYVAYDVTPLLTRGIDGSGQTIAVVARSDFNPSDVLAFQQRYGVAPRSPQRVFPDGNPGVGAANGICAGISDRRQLQTCIDGEEGEVLLDVEWAGAMAPEATVLADVGFTDIDVSLIDIVDHHPEAKTITMSFGACERLDASDATLFGPLYVQAAAQGQTVLVAAGDNGADECQDGGARGVSVLASSTDVTAVGGTALNPGFDAAGDATGYVSESAWNDISGASGGGASVLVRKPGYQNAPGVPADGARDLPDIALLASAETAGYVMVQNGSDVVVGGTSVATPSWAGLVALLNQAGHTQGQGSLNPALYALGRAQYGGSGAAVFHDVTIGGNSFDGVRGYSAGPGFDLVTGLGTPDAARLIDALAPPVCVGDCNGDGVVSVSELLTGADIALGVLPLSQCPAFDPDGDGRVNIGDLVTAAGNILHGCP